MSGDDLPGRVDEILRKLIEGWYQRVAHRYVTEGDSRDLGVEPEIKRFHEPGKHRIKFARAGDLDVTYGLAVSARRDDLVYIVSSVNNKSGGFNYERFVNRLQSHYWKTRTDKPWTEEPYDHLAYQDVLGFEPDLDKSVKVESRSRRADIVRLYFELNSKGEALLEEREDLFQDLLEDYCLSPLKRIYAESYHEQSGPRDS